MASKLQKNLFYNITFQLLNVLLPLITVPYLSRALGVESNGLYSYTYSIVNYFMIFAMLGISNYGNRRIAKTRDNPERLANEFSSIYIIQAILTFLSIGVYAIYCLFFAEYKTISWIEIIFLFSTLLDISWFYFGLEEFKKTATRNAIVKILSVILILIFIHNPEDIYLYTIIMASSTLFSQIILWLGIKKYLNCKLIRPTFQHTISHLKGIIILFIPVISYSIYRIMDKIMLGAIYSVDEVAFYEYAEKIINIPVGIITAIGTVMLPKMSNLVEKNQHSEIKKYIYKSLELICFLTLPCCFGLIAVSHNFTTLFLGSDFARTGIIVQLLTLTVIFTAWANIIRTQWLIPNEKDHIYIITTIIAAGINFIINLCLIPSLGGIGAAIGTICSEFFIMFSQSFLCRKELNYQKVARPTTQFVVSSVIMFAAISCIPKIISDPILCITAQICAGGTIYLLLNIKTVKALIKQALRK